MRTKTKYQVILSSIKGEYYRKLDAVARREKSTIMIGGKKITPRFPFELANAAKEVIFPSIYPYLYKSAQTARNAWAVRLNDSTDGFLEPKFEGPMPAALYGLDAETDIHGDYHYTFCGYKVIYVNEKYDKPSDIHYLYYICEVVDEDYNELIDAATKYCEDDIKATEEVYYE